MREILSHHRDFQLSISATTRAPRPGELDGREYFFLSDEAFNAIVDSGEMLEHAVVHGSKQYGTPKQPVLTALAAGNSVILEIDVQGAMQVKKNMPECLTIFIAPPNMLQLEKRLAGRGTESELEQQIRLATAETEMRLAKNFDFQVINEDVSKCAEEVVKLATS